MKDGREDRGSGWARMSPPIPEARLEIYTISHNKTWAIGRQKKPLGGNMCFHLLSLNEFTVYLMNIPGLIVNGSLVDERKIV